MKAYGQIRLLASVLAGLGGCHPTLVVQETFVPNTPCMARQLSPAAMNVMPSAEETVIAATCWPGLTAPPPGKTAMESQSLVIDQAGNAHAILERFQARPETTTMRLTTETLRRIRQGATIALASAPHECEPVVVDGMGCHVEIRGAGKQAVADVAYPTQHRDLRPLLHHLVMLLPEDR